MCTGSRACIEACPYGVIQFDAVRRKAHKCDLCHDRVVAGELPVCAEVCMTDAITFGEKEMLLQKARDLGREIDRKKSAMSIIYLKPLPKNTLARASSRAAPGSSGGPAARAAGAGRRRRCSP
ncbi:4Fe-4S dicluster domain-containing protein [Desulfocurvus vexinensis]|uniref:4Fe-4S dicluster domain-containing protein n=1 Tax=Desulfocurvus vexinensis TaxID=399548 RepID=UPI0004BA5D3C